VLALCCHARIGPESDFDSVACLEGRWGITLFLPLVRDSN